MDAMNAERSTRIPATQNRVAFIECDIKQRTDQYGEISKQEEKWVARKSTWSRIRCKMSRLPIEGGGGVPAGSGG